ncbi:SusC/RagA family TonB-linked outer membrane protein [Elizabethkingia ursingii]|uniref:SusC/RagA family protein n=1 Tax=Elizabethkingia ursingii TaxID=1756150 RepID=A0AAJ3NBC6_9FLAO|nr:SusC/RagA family TonB-linked outer membrane protein [Elizabethkingia ursingii]AQX09323.1 SusC/RagA family protein [Elizabethkingia ursingii]OPB74309.1 SusC/RagA family protein [Elizabethkingia ursingii]
MKKLTNSVLVVVLSSSFVFVNAQKKQDSTKTKDIEGVVVTALGIKREKKSLGYASQEIKADALTGGTTNTGNIASQLSGKVAGLTVNTNANFGGSASMVIRGVKSLGGSSPLIVIDGSPVNNSSTFATRYDLGNALSDISQDDIESINVLKGAAASALYGERGLNGVIVITTKNGKGKDDTSWGVTLNSSIQAGFIDKSTFPEYQTSYGAGNKGSGKPNSWYYGTAPDGKYYANFGEDASWGPAFDPNQLVYQWDSFLPTSPNYGKATPWVAAKNGPIKFLQNPVTYVNSISLEKGTKGLNFMLSYDNMLSNGLYPNSDLKKNTVSTKVNYDFTPKLHSTVYATLTLQNTVGRNETGYSGGNLMSLFRQWWQTNVDVLAQRDAYFNNNEQNISWNRKSATDGTAAYHNNPYFQRYQNYQSDDRTRIFSYASLTYDVSKNISVTGKATIDNTNLLFENRVAVGSVPLRFGTGNNPVGSGYERNNITSREINLDLIVNYKFNITDNIGISGVVGANNRRNNYSSIYNSTEGGLTVPGLYNLGNSKSPVLAPLETEYRTQTQGLYVTTSLDFYKTYYIDATYRRDNSSTLPANAARYSYPSITGAVILSQLIKTNWLNFWKIRGNYAEVGGTADPYQLMPYYVAAGSFSGVPMFGSQTVLANANLKPQRSKEFEFGTEAQLFNNRLTFDVAYYKTKTLNQIISLPISSGAGLLSAVVNAGRIDNYGVEVQLGVVPVRNNKFTWNVDFNWGQNRNKVVDLLEGISNYQLGTFQGGVSLNATKGETWGTLRGGDFTYDANGNKLIDPKTGAYIVNPNQVIGNVMPKWTGGVRNTFKYGNLSFGFLIDVRKGGDIYSNDMYYGLATGMYKETGDYRNQPQVLPGVNPDGKVNTTPVVVANNSPYDGYGVMPQSRFIYDGSFIKLREANISYSLPKSVLKGTFLNELRLSLVGRNLWIIHKNLPYADPEAMVGGGVSTGATNGTNSVRGYGYSVGSLPTTRDIGFSITAKF